MIDEHDDRRRRCPTLGHEISFAYCRCPGSTLPCRKVFDCWFETFDIREFMQTNFEQSTIDAITAPPPSKMQTIFDIIRQAQEKKK
jgi:hypothetical protein